MKTRPKYRANWLAVEALEPRCLLFATTNLEVVQPVFESPTFGPELEPPAEIARHGDCASLAAQSGIELSLADHPAVGFEANQEPDLPGDLPVEGDSPELPADEEETDGVDVDSGPHLDPVDLGDCFLGDGFIIAQAGSGLPLSTSDDERRANESIPTGTEISDVTLIEDGAPLSASGPSMAVPAMKSPASISAAQRLGEDQSAESGLLPAKYFTGDIALRAARWAASPHDLTRAETLLEVVNGVAWERGDLAGDRERLASVAATSHPTEISPVEDGSDRLASSRSTMRPSMSVWEHDVEWNTASSAYLFVAAAEDLATGSNPNSEPVVEVQVPAIAPSDLDATRGSSSGAEARHDPVWNWCVFGGIGLWQMIFAARGRKRKAPCSS